MPFSWGPSSNADSRVLRPAKGDLLRPATLDMTAIATSSAGATGATNNLIQTWYKPDSVRHSENSSTPFRTASKSLQIFGWEWSEWSYDILCDILWPMMSYVFGRCSWKTLSWWILWSRSKCQYCQYFRSGDIGSMVKMPEGGDHGAPSEISWCEEMWRVWQETPWVAGECLKKMGQAEYRHSMSYENSESCEMTMEMLWRSCSIAVAL